VSEDAHGHAGEPQASEGRHICIDMKCGHLKNHKAIAFGPFCILELSFFFILTHQGHLALFSPDFAKTCRERTQE
jgi:hypothetical protein